MSTLKEQIQNRCIHFTGIMDKCCTVGVNYEDVRIGKPYQFPCLKKGGECAKSQFPTEEDAQKQAEAIDRDVVNSLFAFAQVKKHYHLTKHKEDKLKCLHCGGELHYKAIGDKEHIWAACTGCGINFGE